jgi:lysophospholipase L1-like esterase
MNICVFGDSVTHASYIKNSWTSLLRQYLEEESQYEVNLFNLGINGNTSNEILKRVGAECDPRQPNVIFFAYGINDSRYIPELSRCLVEINEFKRNTQEIIEVAKKFTDIIFFVGLVLGDDSQLNLYHELIYGKKVFDINRSKEYDCILEDIAVRNDCKYIHLLDKLEPTDFIDGLHPNETGHKKMFEIIKALYP